MQKQLLFLYLIALLLLFIFFAFLPKPAPGPVINLKLIAEGLMAPVAMDCPKDGSNRLFICEQTGKIKIIKNKILADKPFLDLSKKVDAGNRFYSEKGLLGIAFHPKYKNNGRFFVYYSAHSSKPHVDHVSVISEFKISSDPDAANISSEKIILTIDQPQSNHNGGQLAFGPDGYLYISLGDGGGAGDKHGTNGNAQNISNLLGKILRIDIDAKSPYKTPPDNPFVANKNAAPEIWAYGLRNPWRFSFDRKTGKLFCADVGQDHWEEIDIIEKGKNYGWRIMEGSYCYYPSADCNQGGLAGPIAEYGHKTGISITGGYVYRGKNIRELEGKYIFADWKGGLFYLENINGKWIMKNLNILGKSGNNSQVDINSFGEDEECEIYLLTQKTTGRLMTNGEVYLISR